ncbi:MULTISPECIES: hypothetical protein [unclassified Dietzia]|uniref:hypothetical protein n=1 Tax=unclassified Dietzia TaxID=2617939 RepID=UPI0012E7E2C4|nr:MULTISPECIES: hypothetical protein [unclassified Dietzia]QGW24265.1 hypothetical protein GJR88_01893 [Dietzia sp. DQ12-45-1b]
MNRIPTPDTDRFDALKADIAAIFRKYPEAIVPAIAALQDAVADHDPRRRAG